MRQQYRAAAAGAAFLLAVLTLTGASVVAGAAVQPARLTRSSAHDVRPAWSPDGQRIAFQSNRTGAYQIWTISHDGTDERRVSQGESDDRHPSWSPDGKLLVFDAGDDRVREIWVMDLEGRNRRQITRLGAFASFPTWSPDGQRIAFFLYRDGVMDLWAVNADAAAPRALTDGFADQRNNNCTFACHGAAWSPDSRTLAFSSADHRSVWTLLLGGGSPVPVTDGGERSHFPWYLADGRLAFIEEHRTAAEAWTDVWALDLAGARPPELLLEKARIQGPYQFDARGERMVFHSPRSGNFDIYLADLTAPGVREALQTLLIDEPAVIQAAAPASEAQSAEGPPISAADVAAVLARVVISFALVLGIALLGARLLQRRRLRRS